MRGHATLIIGLPSALSCTRVQKTDAPTMPIEASQKALPKRTAPAPARKRPPRAPVASCPPRAAPTEVWFDPRIDIGWAGSASWLYGYAKAGAVLAHLDASGKLALTPVPLDDAQASVVEGDRIWLYAQRVSASRPTRWTAIDVSRPDAPIAGRVEPLRVGAKLDWAVALGVSSLRAVVIAGAMDERELVVVDTKRRVAIGPPVALGKGFDPARAWCHVDRCAVVAIENEGGGPARRLVVLRVSRSGKIDREALAPDWIGSANVAESGDAMIVGWSDNDGLKLRRLDLWGRPLGSALDVKWDAARYVQSEDLLVGPGGVFFAVGERGRWSVAKLEAGGSIGAFRELPGAEHYFLAATPLDDGVAWASFSTEVDYRELGKSGAMTHSWSSSIATGFTPAAEGARSLHDGA